MTLARQYIETVDWAILEDYLALMAAIEERDIEGRDDIVKSIETRFGRIVPGTRETTVRGDVAIIPISGPLFRHANMITEISGATSFERLATDIGAVMGNDDIARVIFSMNSPGGEVDGMSETASLIRSFRGVKPMTTFVSHLGASAAYALAAATDRIIAGDTAMLGSIGTVMTATDRSKQDEKRGIQRMEFVSSQTPLKRVDVFSEDDEERSAARAVIQKRVDSLAQVLINSVAEDRGVEPEAIAALAGAVFVGQEALEVGLADGLGTLESLVQSMIDADGSTPAGTISFAAAQRSGIRSQEDTMAKTDEGAQPAAPAVTRAYLDVNHAELVASIREEGRTAGLSEGAEQERDRILGIHAIESPGFDELKSELMADPEKSKGDAAVAILTAKGAEEKQTVEKAKDELADDEKEVAAVASVTPAGDETEEAEAEAAVEDVLQHVGSWQKTGRAE